MMGKRQEVLAARVPAYAERRRQIEAEPLPANIGALIDEAAALFSRAAQGPEGQEGTGAFLQKRKPHWVPA